MRVIYCTKIEEMWQSYTNDPWYYIVQPGVDGLKTGAISSCVAVIALSYKVGLEYVRICGQHGGGSIENIDFSQFLVTGNILDSPDTRFKVFYAPCEHSPQELTGQIQNVVKVIPSIFESEFELYAYNTAHVTRKGEVIHPKFGEVDPVVRFKARDVANR